ncbi:AcrR family transcriptional regulator [Arthrobacter pigmenti]|uniref:AcrR family transcriptional regulator n=1 Tax=Arthrobacter pigmenti TaxID=271432 RepID=A0A846RP73_9MICC|nr:TetR/AcrR family transcriptional regulator [Arthrobacter pigmenti]NJC22164.1 AcrR family transcriptional regulator [Arthrobacter pigmenti]
MNLREPLLEAAITLLDKGGPENVTLREVGRIAGVSRTAPYLYFASKSALLAAIATQELRALERTVEDLPRETLTAWDMLWHAIRHYVSWAQERPERFKLVFSTWESESDELRRAADRAAELLVELIVRCQDEASLPKGDPWVLAAAIRAFAHGAATLELSGHLLVQDRQPLNAVYLVENYLAAIPFLAPGNDAPAGPQRDLARKVG